MRRRLMEPARPQARDDVELVLGGRNGVWWQARDGLQVRIAGSERDDRATVERARLSVLALIAAMLAGGRSRV